MIRKILVPVRGDGKGDNVLVHASVLAHRFKAHIEVAHCRARPEDLMPYGVPLPAALRRTIVEQTYELANAEEAGLREELAVLSKSLGLVENGQMGTEATVSYAEEVGRQVDIIKRHGRLADIIAVAQPETSSNLGTNTLKAALFNSGRPVLMCPAVDKAPATIGTRVALGWNGSAEAARALSQSHRLLVEAEHVTVLSNGTDAGSGTSVDDLLEFLSLHKIPSEAHVITEQRRVGAALLEAAADVASDLLVIGAYGDSHESETLFGGNTQTVVDTATMPVLMSH